MAGMILTFMMVLIQADVGGWAMPAVPAPQAAVQVAAKTDLQDRQGDHRVSDLYELIDQNRERIFRNLERRAILPLGDEVKQVPARYEHALAEQRP